MISSYQLSLVMQGARDALLKTEKIHVKQAVKLARSCISELIANYDRKCTEAEQYDKVCSNILSGAMYERTLDI